MSTFFAAFIGLLVGAIIVGLVVFFVILYRSLANLHKVVMDLTSTVQNTRSDVAITELTETLRADKSIKALANVGSAFLAELPGIRQSLDMASEGFKLFAKFAFKQPATPAPPVGSFEAPSEGDYALKEQQELLRKAGYAANAEEMEPPEIMRVTVDS